MSACWRSFRPFAQRSLSLINQPTRSTLPFRSSTLFRASSSLKEGNGNVTATASHISLDAPDEKETDALSKGVRKVRQHVNPLQASYQRPLLLADNWIESAYPGVQAGESRAFVVDVGCAEGRFTLRLARESASLSLCVLGLEIRRPMVRHCLQEAQRLRVDNVYFLACNANVDLANVLRSIQVRGHRIQSVLFQFPDPHFKRRHHKRRVVNFPLVRSLAEVLPQGTQLFVQTDIEALARDMVFRAGSTPWFSPAAGYDMHTLDGNVSPHAVRTDRENKTLARGEPVYRMLYVRNDVPYDALWQEPPEPVVEENEDEEYDNKQ